MKAVDRPTERYFWFILVLDFFFFIEMLAKAGLELNMKPILAWNLIIILLPQPCECWNDKHFSLGLAC